MSAAYLICLAIVSIAVLEEVLLVLLFRPFKPGKKSLIPKVTVMVAMRNEENNVERCLNGLFDQQFDGEFEILVGDDGSEDGTWEKLRSYEDPRLRLVKVTSVMGNARGKANVIAHLAKHASGDIWLITDADCHVNPEWVQTMSLNWPENAGAVNGLTQVKGNGFQHLEWLKAQGMLHIINGRYNITGIGNNMAARKQAYEATGGYARLPFSLTEDRALAVALDEKGYDVQSRVSSGTLAETKAIKGWKEIISQRRRWMSGAVQAPAGIFVLLVIQALYYPAIIGVLLYSWKTGLAMLLVKCAMQAAFIFRLHRLCTLQVRWYNWLFYEVYAGLMAWVHITVHLIPGGISWKGRKFTDRK